MPKLPPEARLNSTLAETRIVVLEWIQNTIREIPLGQKASDVKAMVEAMKELVALVGKMGDNEKETEKVEETLLSAAETIGKAMGGGVDGLFAGDEEDDEDASDDD